MNTRPLSRRNFLKASVASSVALSAVAIGRFAQASEASDTNAGMMQLQNWTSAGADSQLGVNAIQFGVPFEIDGIQYTLDYIQPVYWWDTSDNALELYPHKAWYFRFHCFNVSDHDQKSDPITKQTTALIDESDESLCPYAMDYSFRSENEPSQKPILHPGEEGEFWLGFERGLTGGNFRLFVNDESFSGEIRLNLRARDNAPSTGKYVDLEPYAQGYVGYIVDNKMRYMGTTSDYKWFEVTPVVEVARLILIKDLLSKETPDDEFYSIVQQYTLTDDTDQVVTHAIEIKEVDLSFEAQCAGLSISFPATVTEQQNDGFTGQWTDAATGMTIFVYSNYCNAIDVTPLFKYSDPALNLSYGDTVMDSARSENGICVYYGSLRNSVEYDTYSPNLDFRAVLSTNNDGSQSVSAHVCVGVPVNDGSVSLVQTWFDPENADAILPVLYPILHSIHRI